MLFYIYRIFTGILLNGRTTGGGKGYLNFTFEDGVKFHILINYF